MPTQWIALLRGINVGGKNIIKMADLRKALKSQGLKDIATYIQSGNLYFQHASGSQTKIESIIRDAIKQDFAIDVPVMARKIEFFRKILSNNPFGKHPIEKISVTILSGKPTKKAIAEFSDRDFKDDQFKIDQSVMYLYCPGGFARTKFTQTWIESRLNVTATTRNWKTISKLVQLVDEI